MTETELPVVAIVTFPMRPDLDAAGFRQLLEEAGPEYTDIPGLRRKYFLAGDGEAGGVYEWESRARAEAFFSADWYAQMQARNGERPSVRLFDAPAIADGVGHHLHLYLP